MRDNENFRCFPSILMSTFVTGNTNSFHSFLVFIKFANVSNVNSEKRIAFRVPQIQMILKTTNFKLKNRIYA